MLDSILPPHLIAALGIEAEQEQQSYLTEIFYISSYESELTIYYDTVETDEGEGIFYLYFSSAPEYIVRVVGWQNITEISLKLTETCLAQRHCNFENQ